MSLWSVLGVVASILVVLAAAFLSSSLRLEVRLDPATARAAARWTLFSVVVDARSRMLEVRLLVWRIVRRSWSDLRDDDGAQGAPRRERRGSPDRSRSWRDAAESWPFYRRQIAIGLARIHVDRCRGSLRIATPDPALTGILYGAACAVGGPLAGRANLAGWRIEPDFVGTFPGGWMDVAVRVRLAALAGLAWRITWFERSRRRAAEKGR
jgi:hypothetical protein